MDETSEDKVLGGKEGMSALLLTLLLILRVEEDEGDEERHACARFQDASVVNLSGSLAMDAREEDVFVCVCGIVDGPIRSISRGNVRKCDFLLKEVPLGGGIR